MRVVFVNRYFHPDHSATSQMLTDLATHLARRGWDVTVITSRQLYEDSRAPLAARETVGAVEVRRVWSSRFGRSSVALRAIDYATFYASAFAAIRREQSAIIVAMTDPPLMSVVAAAASRRVVNWTQDLFPEVAIALGMKIPGIVARVRNWSLRRARLNVVIGELMAARIGVPAVVQHNWAGADLRPVARDEAAPFTVAYSGNVGRAHEFETMLAAMRALPDVQFVITGGGAQFESLRGRAPANARFRGYVPREQLSESLGDADVHLVTLLPSLEGLIVPSKIYGILAAGRPVVFIGAPDGEVARLVRQHACGLVVSSGDSEGLVRALRHLEENADERRMMGRRGRLLYDERFALELAVGNWERLLSSVADA